MHSFLYCRYYYSERILTRVPVFSRVAVIAGAHHERMDGRGFYKGLTGEAIPLGAQVLAVADRYEELASERPGKGPAGAEALEVMRQEVGARLAEAPFDALVQELGGHTGKPARQREVPADLTARELEVLVLVARGASNREIAQHLVISEKTAGHHRVCGCRNPS